MEQFRVVLSGRVLDGFDAATARGDLARLLGKDESFAAQFLAGHARTVKYGVDAKTAVRYVTALRAIGVECKFETETLDFDVEGSSAAPAPNSAKGSEPQSPGRNQESVPQSPPPPLNGAVKKKTRRMETILTAVFAVFGIISIAKCTGGGPDKTVAEDANCRRDIQCWGNKNDAAASVYCKDEVEKLAQYSARWTKEGMFSVRFSHFRWLNRDIGTLTYIGDMIQFQNGFGAYQNYIYECDFDAATNRVLDVRARPGRL
jgi:hypothetical protein